MCGLWINFEVHVRITANIASPTCGRREGDSLRRLESQRIHYHGSVHTRATAIRETPSATVSTSRLKPEALVGLSECADAILHSLP